MTPTDRPDPAAGSGRGSGAAWGVGQALALVVGAHVVFLFGGALVIGNQPEGATIPATTQLWASLPFWLAIGAGAWWLVSSTSEEPVPDALGLRLRPVDVPVGIVVGVVMQIVVIPVVYLPLYDLFGTSRSEVEELARDLIDTAHGAWPVAALLVLTCVGAPIAEEVLYRGVLQRGAGRTNALVGVAVAALVFGVAHLQPLQFVGLALFGASAGLLAWRTGRLGPAVVAHVAFNAATVLPELWRR